MVVDASALLALQFAEPGCAEIADKLLAAETILIGAPTLFEAAMVLEGRLSGQAALRLPALLNRYGVEIVPFTPEHWETAFDAFVRYGKGRHPAALNFGDCLSYAVAKLARQPLLYVGDDFARTDIERA